MNPRFGLLSTARPYRCDVCGHVHDVNTNHTDRCYSTCPECSWRGGFDSAGNLYRADIGKERPHIYAGGPVIGAEVNPWGHGVKTWRDDPKPGETDAKWCASVTRPNGHILTVVVGYETEAGAAWAAMLEDRARP